jgi:hypothetical protein
MDVAEIKVVATKTFVLRSGVWTDTTYDPERTRVTRVQFGSTAYFDLLAKHPEWGKYLALGQEVIAVADGVAYQIGPDVVEATPQPWSDPQTALQRLLAWLRSIGR